MVEPKVIRMGTSATRPLRAGRGTMHRLVGAEDGATGIDVHLNVINADSGLGPYHVHDHTENVYFVLDGAVEAVVAGKRLHLEANDVAYIPPGVPHAAGSDGSGPATVLEIYAPVGRDFRILADNAESILETSDQ